MCLPRAADQFGNALQISRIGAGITLLPEQVSATALPASKGLLLLAVTATAMRSRMDLLMQMGWRPAVPVLTATLASFAAALGFAVLLL